ncbi:hypothetical protein ACFVAQ_23360 [Streptomyces sp. NPDC057651]|uniref:hypothetical protein n=1 Tax=Streptomyces sp. NPDC057651 TaxID=3346194 RepID=UPI00367EFEA3
MSQTLERTTEIMDDKPYYSQRLESKTSSAWTSERANTTPDVDVADVDHVVVPSVLLTRPCHGTDRHIHITKSLPTCEEAGGHASN